VPRIGVVTDTRPNFEEATYLGHLALRHAVDYFSGRGYMVDDLVGPRAVRAEVLSSFERNDPVLFFGVGHGDSDHFTGQYYNVVFWTCDNSALSDRIVYALSCITAAGLGLDAVNNKGCRCYIGYDREFAWIQDRIVDPMEDRYGRAFYEPVLELLYRLADGATTGEAYRASIDRWNDWIDYWSRSDDPLAPLILKWLLWDRDHQRLIGDPNAKVGPAVVPPVPVPLMALLGFIPLLFTIGTMFYSEAVKYVRVV